MEFSRLVKLDCVQKESSRLDRPDLQTYSRRQREQSTCVPPCQSSPLTLVPYSLWNPQVMSLWLLLIPFLLMIQIFLLLLEKVLELVLNILFLNLCHMIPCLHHIMLLFRLFVLSPFFRIRMKHSLILSGKKLWQRR